MTQRRIDRRRRERGAILLVLLTALTITAILSAVAFQEWSQVLRRDNEAEMIFRAQEIVRAINKYRRDRGQLPVKLDQLMEPGSKGQYFLRHLYKDPLVKGGKWGLLYMGPGGGILDPSVPPVEAGAASGLGDGLSQLQPPGQAGLPGQQPGQPGQPGAPGQGGIFGSSSLSAGGETTGLPIAGVKTLCKEKPFRIYREHEEYTEWLFTILDLEQQQAGRQRANDGTDGSKGTTKKQE